MAEDKVKEEAREPELRAGSAVRQQEAEDFAERRASGGEITSNGVFTKVLRDGHVEVLPTSEIYAYEADERIEGVEVADPTVIQQPGVMGASLQDRLEREFNTQERGGLSKQHAQGAAGPIPGEVEIPEVEFDEGAYEEDVKSAARDQDKAAAAAEKETEKAAKRQEREAKNSARKGAKKARK
jgi:hypothetical protein